MKSFETPTTNDTEKLEKNDVNAVELSEKEKNIEKIRKGLDETADAKGLKIDENIKEIVVALNAIGLNTTQSCEGHCGGDEVGLVMPWVEIAAPNEPEYRFNNEEEIIRRVAAKRGLSFEEVKRSHVPDAYWEAMKEAAKMGETDEYKKWNEQNEALLNKTLELLKEYYDKDEFSGNECIHIENDIEGCFRIYCSTSEDFDPNGNWDALNEREKKSAMENLPRLRSEMDRFAKFLLEKYLKE